LSAFLWVIDLPFANRHHHGGLLRYFNLSRHLLAQGHSVTFAVRFDQDRDQASAWLESLREAGTFTDFCAIDIDPSLPRWHPAANLLLPFGVHGLLTRPFLNSVIAALNTLAERYNVDTVIVSSPQLLFAAHHFKARFLIGDFCDSLTLYRWRESRHALACGNFRKAITELWYCFHFLFQERYSSRDYTANIFVSEVDKRIFDRIGDPSRNFCITNGIQFPNKSGTPKKPLQLVFSGAMNFPPNFEAALWFLDHVFPLVLARQPNATIVIAGAMPDPRLAARADHNILIPGFVPDLNQVLAESALYVAPLVSGSGFKNKIVEAIVSGTFIVGTSFSVEFLPPEIRSLIEVRDDPTAMADAICEVLAHPEAFSDRLARLSGFIARDYSWPAKAAELARLADRSSPV